MRGTINVPTLRDAVDPSSLLGVRWQPSAGTVTIYATATPDEAELGLRRDAIIGSAGGANGAAKLRVVMVPTHLSAKDIGILQNDVMAVVRSLDLKGSVSSSIDVTCGAVMMLFEDQDDLVNVRERIPASQAVGLVFAPNLVSSVADRYDHHQDDQSGGLWISPVDENSWSYLGHCTSGIAFETPSGTGEYAITAGHCLNKQAASSTSMQWACDATLYQGGVNLGSYTWCIRYQYGGQVDAVAQLKYGNEGGSREAMIHGGNHTMVWMMGWDAYRSNSAIGDQVCHSGRNWAGSPCGTITSFSTDWCQSSSSQVNQTCWDDMIDTSMPVIKGDSGAAVWAVRNGFTYYIGIVQSTGGVITHIEDIRSALGLGNVVYVN